jgi:hypothetical protein
MPQRGRHFGHGSSRSIRFSTSQQDKRMILYGRLFIVLLAIVALYQPQDVRSQDHGVGESVPTPAAPYGPFGVGASTRKSLPAQDCLHCFGPAACAPCDSHHQGFLFYGTCPWDDDGVNGFDDCVHGDCGHVAARLSRAWIRLHGHCGWPFHRSHGSGKACCGEK